MSLSWSFEKELSKIFDKKELEEFKKYCFKPLKKSIRLSTNKIDWDIFKEITENRWWKLQAPRFISNRTNKDIFYIDRQDTSIALGNTFWHKSGYFYIQEIAAWLPARFLDVNEWDMVLDMAASPWWKSTQISNYLLEHLNKKAWFVLSNDVDNSRIGSLAHNINRMGAYNTWIANFNGFMYWSNLWEQFDHVLLDAPCSGEWTAFKSDDSLSYRNKESINNISWTQRQLLISWFKALKPWGSLVYSTCTLNPYENEKNIQNILDKFGWAIELEDVELIDKSPWISKYWNEEMLKPKNKNKVARFWPHIQKTGWFFIAKLKKKESLNYSDQWENSLAPNNPFALTYWKNFQNQVRNYLKKSFSIDKLKEDFLFIKIKDKVFVTSKGFLEFKDQVYFKKIWVPVFKYDRNGFRPTHFFGVVLGEYVNSNYVNLTYDDAQKYSEYKNISLSDIDGQWDGDRQFVVVKYQNYPISVWKIIDNKLKNKFVR